MVGILVIDVVPVWEDNVSKLEFNELDDKVIFWEVGCCGCVCVCGCCWSEDGIDDDGIKEDIVEEESWEFWQILFFNVDTNAPILLSKRFEEGEGNKPPGIA